MPPTADSRVAFLLIHYHIPRGIRHSRSRLTKKAIAAISFGFFAMLRFHSCGKFFRENLTLVLRGGKEISPERRNNVTIQRLLKSNSVVGFYFTFDDKFHPGARAYFCRVGDIHRQLKVICPLKHLETLMQSQPDEMFFPSSEITREVLTKIMRNVASITAKMFYHTCYG